MPATYDTIIIGLGAAGTAAAATLAQAGKKVLALEAQDRVGGRVHTVPFGDSVVELGAEWIHGTESSSLYDLAVNNNITILPQDLQFKLYNSDGTTDREDIINEITLLSYQLYDDPPEDPEPLGQYMTRRIHDYIKTNYPSLENDTEFIEKFLAFLDLVVNNHEGTNSWNDVTTHSRYTELGGPQHMSWHTNGYKTTLDILLNKYNNGPGYPSLEIKLNAEVTKIEWPQNPADNVLVTVRDGTTYSSRTAIVTVSLGVLKERLTTLFSPELPSYKSKLINTISIGVVNKIVLRFDEVFWPKDGVFFGFLWKAEDKRKVPAEDWWTTEIFAASCPLGNRKALTVWTSGNGAKLVREQNVDVDNSWIVSPILSKAFETHINVEYNSVKSIKYICKYVNKGSDMAVFAVTSANDEISQYQMDRYIETLPEDVVKRKVVELIRRFMGRNTTIPEPVEMLRSKWYSNPFTRGSYSYDNIESPKYPTARTDLGAPLCDASGAPRLLFAGEATDPTHFSTVHGAIDSGRREAMRLLTITSKI